MVYRAYHGHRYPANHPREALRPVSSHMSARAATRRASPTPRPRPVALSRAPVHWKDARLTHAERHGPRLNRAWQSPSCAPLASGHLGLTHGAPLLARPGQPMGLRVFPGRLPRARLVGAAIHGSESHGHPGFAGSRTAFALGALAVVRAGQSFRWRHDYLTGLLTGSRPGVTMRL